MNDYSIVTDPIAFRKAFLTQVNPSFVDEKYAAMFRVILYFVWRGAFRSRAAVVLDHVQTDLGYLCLSAYLAFLPYLQMTRMGYPTDALVLLRAHMERIALVGYLNANRGEIGKYVAGHGNLQKKAMAWAKAETPENWMILYGIFSNVAHSKIIGPAGHIFSDNEIGIAFRQDLSPDPEKGADFAEILIAGALYSIASLDPFTSTILGPDKFVPFLNDPEIVNYVRREDLEEFLAFAQSWVEEYSSNENNS